LTDDFYAVRTASAARRVTRAEAESIS